MVNGSEISVREFDDALAKQKQRLQSMFGGKMPTDEVFETRIKQQVLDQLITRRVLEQFALSHGYRISDVDLAKKIHTMDAFQQDGKFTPNIYKEIIKSQGMSVAEFEYLYRRDLLLQQYQDGLTKTAFVDDFSIAKLDKFQKQTRDVDYLLFAQQNYMPDTSFSDDELKQYFNEHQDQYMQAEQVRVAYVELKADDLAVNVPVDEEALRRRYDEYVTSVANNEQRKARHILISIEADDDQAVRDEKKQKLSSLREQIIKGTSFEELAKTASQDPGSAPQGGDLGWINRGMMVPAFDEALYKLKKGETSDIVQTEFGYHIIQLEDIKGETPESFEKRKAQLIADMQQHEIDNAFYERSELLATQSYENDETLQTVAENLNLKIQESELFTRISGKGIAANPAVREAAFLPMVLNQRRNSEVIELGKNHILVLRLLEHNPAKPKSFDAVKSQLEVALKSEKAKLATQAAALQALANVEKGQTLLEQAAADKRSQLNKLGYVSRDNATVDNQIISSAFSMQKPTQEKPVYKTVELHDGVALVALKDVKDSSEPAKPEELQAIQRQLETSLSNQEFVAVIDFLKANSEIVTTKDLFQ